MEVFPACFFCFFAKSNITAKITSMDNCEHTLNANGKPEYLKHLADTGQIV